MKPLKQVNALGLAGGYSDGWEVKSVEIGRGGNYINFYLHKLFEPILFVDSMDYIVSIV